MTGPQFNEEQTGLGGKIKNFFKLYTLKAVVPVLAFILIVIGIYYSNNSPSQTASLSDSANQQTEQTDNSTIAKENTTTAKEVPSEIKETVSNNDIKEIAPRGASYTTLARQAAKSYIEANTDLKASISKEQKIYIEDYLRKQIQKEKNGKGLDPGDEITFSKDMLKTAVEKAQSLTPGQISNLSKYVSKVPSI